MSENFPFWRLFLHERRKYFWLWWPFSVRRFVLSLRGEIFIEDRDTFTKTIQFINFVLWNHRTKNFSLPLEDENRYFKGSFSHLFFTSNHLQVDLGKLFVSQVTGEIFEQEILIMNAISYNLKKKVSRYFSVAKVRKKFTFFIKRYLNWNF